MRQLAVVLALAGLAAAMRCGDDVRNDNARYNVVVDAGSTGSRVHVYRWVRADFEWTLDREYSCSKSGFPPLAELKVHNDTAVSEFVTALLDAAKQWLPAGKSDARHPKAFNLWCTGGCRNTLSATEANHLFRSLRRKVFSDGSVGAPWNSMKVITGYEEAAALWQHLAELYKTERIAGLDVGGQTVQFVMPLPDIANDDDYQHVRAAESEDEFDAMRRYAASPARLLPLVFEAGMDQTREWHYRNMPEVATGIAAKSQTITVQWPCHPVGGVETKTVSVGSGTIELHLSGTGDFNACVQRLRVFGDSLAASRSQRMHSALPDDMKLVALSSAFHAANELGCAGDTTVGCIAERAAVECRKPWSFAKHGQLCERAAIIHVLLVHGLQLALNRPVRFANSEGSVSLGWGLGASLLTLDPDRLAEVIRDDTALAQVQERVLKDGLNANAELQANPNHPRRDALIETVRMAQRLSQDNPIDAAKTKAAKVSRAFHRHDRTHALGKAGFEVNTRYLRSRLDKAGEHVARASLDTFLSLLSPAPRSAGQQRFVVDRLAGRDTEWQLECADQTWVWRREAPALAVELQLPHQAALAAKKACDSATTKTLLHHHADAAPKGDTASASCEGAPLDDGGCPSATATS